MTALSRYAISQKVVFSHGDKAKIVHSWFRGIQPKESEHLASVSRGCHVGVRLPAYSFASS